MNSQRSFRQRGHRVRSGFTLVECMATLSVLMVLGLAASTLLSKVTQIGLETNHNKSSRRMIVRMSRQLRQDITAADSVTINRKGAALLLQLPNQTIAYEITSSPMAVDRRVQADNETVSNERYGLPGRCAPEFSQSDQRVMLRLTAPKARNAWVIEAVKP